MPHIYAQTDADAYFAMGYCMAQETMRIFTSRR
jgi:acyl-homoserine lactone acylase PvdQ